MRATRDKQRSALLSHATWQVERTNLNVTDAFPGCFIFESLGGGGGSPDLIHLVPLIYFLALLT
ncbi:hypothetical protein BDV23DRAFT_158525, partial [Aspergillus alliaceus]